MDISTINYWAVLVATLSSFAVGFLWYSPMLFAKTWMKSNDFAEEQVKKFSKGRAFGWTFVFSLIMAFNLAMFLNDPATDVSWGTIAGFLAGFGWAAMSIGVTAVFENRPWKYILVNGFYHVVALTVMGAILGAWR